MVIATHGPCEAIYGLGAEAVTGLSHLLSSSETGTEAHAVGVSFLHGSSLLFGDSLIDE